jgi:hypothetical protein
MRHGGPYPMTNFCSVGDAYQLTGHSGGRAVLIVEERKGSRVEGYVIGRPERVVLDLSGDNLVRTRTGITLVRFIEGPLRSHEVRTERLNAGMYKH